MKNGLLAMAYLSPTSDDLSDADSDDSDEWASPPVDDVTGPGPGPPPPEFLLPPPPLPDFMLQELEGEDCVRTSLPEHFANCDMSFVSTIHLLHF